MSRRGWLAGVVVLFVIAFMSTSASAVVILPGGNSTLSGTTLADRPELAGTVIVDEVKDFVGKDVFGATAFTGKLQVRIVKEDVSGTLDFYYRFFETDISGPDPIIRLTTTDFSGWATDVDYRTDGLPLVSTYGYPYGADRTANGRRVGFDFYTAPADDDGITPGLESKFFFIKTDAFSYKPGSISIIDGGIANVAGYAPAVPEPGTMMLLGSGLVGLAGWGRKKFRK